MSAIITQNTVIEQININVGTESETAAASSVRTAAPNKNSSRPRTSFFLALLQSLSAFNA